MVNHDLSVQGDLNVKGKIISIEEKLVLDALQVSGVARFDGSLSAADDMVFSVPAGKRFVFKIAEDVVATLSEEGFKMFNNSLCDIPSILSAIHAKGLDDGRALKNKVDELIAALQEADKCKIHPIVVALSAMLHELRPKTRLAFDLERKISEMLDGGDKKASIAAAALEAALMEALHMFLASGAATSSGLQAAIAEHVAHFQRAASTDFDKANAKVDNVMQAVKAKSVMLGNSFLPTTCDVYKAEKKQLANHVDALTLLAAGRAATLSDGVTIQINSTIRTMVSNVEELKAIVVSSFEEATADAHAKRADVDAVKESVIGLLEGAKHEIVASLMNARTVVSNEVVTMNSKVAAKAAETKMSIENSINKLGKQITAEKATAEVASAFELLKNTTSASSVPCDIEVISGGALSKLNDVMVMIPRIVIALSGYCACVPKPGFVCI